MAIDLTFDPAQLTLGEDARQLFTERCPLTRVRELEGGTPGYDPALWHEMAQRGWLGWTLPAEYGGRDGRFLDLYLLYEEMGRFLVPSPHLDTVALSGDLLLRVGTEAQKAQVLPAIASGRVVVSAATLEPSGTFGPSGLSTVASVQGGDFLVSGTKLLASFADSADYLLLTARSAGGGMTVFLADADSAGISTVPLQNLAGGELYQVDFDGLRVPGDAVVGAVEDGWAPFSAAATKAAVLQTATIVGAARAVLEMTNQYAKDREQFGRPIGTYQAVQYLVSDILIALHSADLLAKQAAYRVDAQLPFRREAAMAIAYGKKAAAHLHRQAHEVHAGVGFMVEHDLQLFSRRSKFWENNLGDARYHQQQLAAALSI
jgi:alkylation response protein AidB-like acyl-CoA dehydrogenase